MGEGRVVFLVLGYCLMKESLRLGCEREGVLIKANMA